MTDVERHLFGTDGVRGVANEDITADLAFNLARAAGHGNHGQVVIGRDTRRSSPMLAAALAAGFNSVGMDVLDLAVIPVGGVSRLVRDSRAAYGVMVSASHNPAQDNGIKFFDPLGTKLSDEDEAEIEARYFEGGPWAQPTGAAVGGQVRMPDRIGRYVDLVTASVEIPADGMEFLVDCANGAAYRAAPELFAQIDVPARFINTEPDGMNINQE